MDDQDLKDINPAFPKAAAGFTLLAGALGILNAIQTLTSVRIYSHFWAAVPYASLALGLVLVVLARSVFVARPWAALAGIAVAAGLTVVSGAWFVYATSHGFISLYALWTPVGGLLGGGFCGAAIAPCVRAEEARARLAAEGMSLGL